MYRPTSGGGLNDQIIGDKKLYRGIKALKLGDLTVDRDGRSVVLLEVYYERVLLNQLLVTRTAYPE